MTHEQRTENANPPPVDRLSQLWRRINQHKIVQWSIAYVAVAYALQQGLMLMGAAFAWPDAVLRASMLLLILGLPVVITLAWYHGERASRHFSAAELTIISLLLVIGAAVFYAFVQPNVETAADQAPAAQQTGVEKARAAANSPVTGISLAVLPFANLSGDASQEFFSDGMTEEITAALAKIPDLRVVARTSAFEFKDQNRNIQAIARALNSTHLVEGSVRRAGTRVRITAQLINADNGASIWTESYDREMTDVFAIQEDIATAIAGALRMPLGLKAGEHLVTNRTADLKAYEDFLRARVIGARARTLPNARAILEEAVVRDPGFAPAWATLSNLYSAAATVAARQAGPIEDARRETQSWLDKMEMAARKAIELDPDLASGYGQLAAVQTRRGHRSEAEKLFRQAFALDAGDYQSQSDYATLLSNAGYLKEALPVRERVMGLEPFVPISNYNGALVIYLNGQRARATEILESIPANIANFNRNYLLATIYAGDGQYGKAADTLLLIDTQVPKDAVEEAARLLRTAPAKSPMPHELPSLPAELNFVYAHIGAEDRVLEYPERLLRVGTQPSGFSMIWDARYAPVRKTERFKKLMRDTGLVDFWRARR